MRAVRGFTLIEAVMVIVITGAIAAAVAVFMRAPVEGYFDSARRAGLTDVADTAVRRIARDLHLALPNSVRVAGGNCIEFLPTSANGRYRAEQDCTGACAGNKLDFINGSTSFDYLGGMSAIPAANDRVVVYNLGIPGADAYLNDGSASDNTALVQAATASTITLTANKKFPFASPGNHFHVIPNADRVASYVCSGVGVDAAGTGTGTLYRYSNYVPSAAMPASCPAPPAGTPILATKVSACNFSYASGVTARSGLASVQISIQESNEPVSLYQEVHVNNTP
ncbi:MAG: prepilin-type N-terminal cleavage/methylation domain-containing protein [Proteobacteria bacterium]|nr:prepilin-type N-terminal cleavage/methylation domain-containing protein [Pseudomonadota bacterium]